MSERVRDFVGAPVFGQCDTEKHLLPSPVTETGKTEARENRTPSPDKMVEDKEQRPSVCRTRGHRGP